MDKHYYLDYYTRHISEDIMPFWDSRCIDATYGGYLTCFDRTGKLTDDNKYIWFQGRQLYVYSLLYNEFEQRREWLDNARHGYAFLRDKAYAGGGRWNYKLDRAGNLLEGTTSIYADFHVMQGLGEYLSAINASDQEAVQILSDTFDAMEKNMFNPDFKDIYENTWQENIIWHDMYMTCLSAVLPSVKVLGLARTRKLLYECIDKITNFFANDEHRLVFEAVSRSGNPDMSTTQGRFINPGHSSESVWFCLEAAKLLRDNTLYNRALQIADWVYEVGNDDTHGGLISYADAGGGIPEALDWYKETDTLWNDKVWWANAEALCSYCMCYAVTGDKKYKERFEKQHEFCKKFFDTQYGEWYERLHPNGSVKIDDKGTPWKCAFHLVRALVFTRLYVSLWPSEQEK